MIDMLTKILIFGLLASTAIANPVGPSDDEDDIPTYTEKVVPGKTTQVPKFGAKKIRPTQRKVLVKPLSDDKQHYAVSIQQTTLVPKAILKTTKPIRSSTRPVRRSSRIPRLPVAAYNDLNSGDYDHSAPVPQRFVPQELGVEYASDVVATPSSHQPEDLVYEYEPRRVHRQQPTARPAAAAEVGSAVGNAPQLRYAVPPQRFVSAAAQAADVPDYAHAGNAYDEKPQPYIFGYELKDGNGSTQSRREQGDDYGNKRGSYGYTDRYGIYRQVDYIADAHGFRAIIKTNEPGTESQDPADVEMHSAVY